MIRQDWSTLKKLMFLKAAAAVPAVEATATGNPLTFETDLARPLKSLLIPFTPVQSGTGDPSPQNIRSILPWNGLKVWNGGKNLLADGTWDVGQYDSGVWQNENKRRTSPYFEIKPGVQYHASIDLEQNKNLAWINYNYFDANKNWLGKRVTNGDSGFNGQREFTTTIHNTNARYMRVTCRAYSSDTIDISTVNIVEAEPMFEVGSVATAYEPYTPITETDISFPSPVYGGTLDVVSGVLTVEWIGKTFKWGEMTAGSVYGTVQRRTGYFDADIIDTTTADGKMCSMAKFLNSSTSETVHFYTSADRNRVFVYLPTDTDDETEIQVAVKLATPQEITLTPEQLTALIGDNTIWSDADGSMTAVYLKKG